ncbi:hypothetical protein GY45DRAFT_1322565 [Cubamyces sp. BRFM 1775]|nr:hypothetical protein GY45DRAFT_1322565 [Cubamyces sp. BRFM 1775]
MRTCLCLPVGHAQCPCHCLLSTLADVTDQHASTPGRGRLGRTETLKPATGARLVRTARDNDDASGGGGSGSGASNGNRVGVSACHRGGRTASRRAGTPGPIARLVVPAIERCGLAADLARYIIRLCIHLARRTYPSTSSLGRSVRHVAMWSWVLRLWRLATCQ